MTKKIKIEEGVLLWKALASISMIKGLKSVVSYHLGRLKKQLNPVVETANEAVQKAFDDRATADENGRMEIATGSKKHKEYLAEEKEVYNQEIEVEIPDLKFTDFDNATDVPPIFFEAFGEYLADKQNDYKKDDRGLEKPSKK